MQNDFLEALNDKYPTHWAASLQTGDRVNATIRHETDGSLNRHNVSVVVFEVFKDSIIASDGDNIFDIPFNELSEPDTLTTPKNNTNG